jgi:hypothetical protein
MPMSGTAIFLAIGGGIDDASVCGGDRTWLVLLQSGERLFGAGNSVIANGRNAI